MNTTFDVFGGILGELGVAPAPSTKPRVVAAEPADDASLASAADALVETPSEQSDWALRAVASYAERLGEERERRAYAEREASRSRSIIGWVVAGAFAVALAFVIGSSRRN